MSTFASSSSLCDSQCVNIPPGFKFKPSDKDLVNYYLIPKKESLSKKNKNKSPSTWFNIEERDVYKIEPRNLNWEKKPYLEDNERYYFVKTKKSSTGKGICRESVKGYHWKNLGDIKSICNGKAWKTSMSFKAKAGSLEEPQKGWVIHEYRLKGSDVDSDLVLCRVIKNEKKKSTIPMTRRQEKRKLREIADQLMAEEDTNPLNHHDCDEIVADLKRALLNAN